jgi:hypothetical protein
MLIGRRFARKGDAHDMHAGNANVLGDGDEHDRAPAMIIERHPQLRAMNIADLPVIALRIVPVASRGDLLAE